MRDTVLTAKISRSRYSHPHIFPDEGHAMDRTAFTEILLKEGFPDAVFVTREPNTVMDVHTHPFEAKALIVDGEMHIRVGDDERLYRVGDVFHLPANKAHAERYGPNGVSYLVGRKTAI
jgi:quercetin dioxygenase-like cupin family protein